MNQKKDESRAKTGRISNPGTSLIPVPFLPTFVIHSHCSLLHEPRSRLMKIRRSQVDISRILFD